MPTEEQIRTWFTYQPPTPEKAEAFTAIQDALEAAFNAAQQACDMEGAARFSKVNGAMLDFALTINRLAPECVDKTAAIRYARMARMAANDVILLMGQDAPDKDEVQLAATTLGTCLVLASYNANAAVALEGK